MISHLSFHKWSFFYLSTNDFFAIFPSMIFFLPFYKWFLCYLSINDLFAIFPSNISLLSSCQSSFCYLSANDLFATFSSLISLLYFYNLSLCYLSTNNLIDVFPQILIFHQWSFSLSFHQLSQCTVYNIQIWKKTNMADNLRITIFPNYSSAPVIFFPIVSYIINWWL
jgi:hypothetical protein